MVSSGKPRPVSLSRRDNLEFEVLFLLHGDAALSQRELAFRLEISLGRTNSCIRSLVARGAVRHVRHRAGQGRQSHAYELTSAGSAELGALAGKQLERKRAEIDRLQAQIAGLLETIRPEGAARP